MTFSIIFLLSIILFQMIRIVWLKTWNEIFQDENESLEFQVKVLMKELLVGDKEDDYERTNRQ